MTETSTYQQELEAFDVSTIELPNEFNRSDLAKFSNHDDLAFGEDGFLSADDTDTSVYELTNAVFGKID